MNEQLSMETLGDMLVHVLKVDAKFIVPKQGNWWNPQTRTADGSKPATWCAYRIEDDPALLMPYYETDTDDSAGELENVSVAQSVARVVLQFVGPRAHELAQNVKHWPQRTDVSTQLARVSGSLFSDISVTPIDFAQEGENTVIAWTVRMRIRWASTLVAEQPIVTSATLGGEVVIP